MIYSQIERYMLCLGSMHVLICQRQCTDKCITPPAASHAHCMIILLSESEITKHHQFPNSFPSQE